MVQKILQCCSKPPDFKITYSVSGSEKDYLVCSSCIKKDYFTKYIVRRLFLEKNNKIFQNEQFEINNESSTISENSDEHTQQNEHDNERGGFIL